MEWMYMQMWVRYGRKKVRLVTSLQIMTFPTFR